MKLALIVCTQMYGRWRENLASWGTVDHQILVVNIRPLTKAYQEGFERAGDADILAFVHDDVTCYDPNWKERVLAEFDDSTVGLVGFGGSTGHGDIAIYQSPYQWQQVAREGRFMSNLVNAEQHGERMTESAEASCLDGFAMFVRQEILAHTVVPSSGPYIYHGASDELNPSPISIRRGWPQETPIAYWAYDYWLSCETRRQGYRIRVVGVSCEHTCPPEYRSYVIDEDCEAAHKWLYDNYRDTFPARLRIR